MRKTMTLNDYSLSANTTSSLSSLGPKAAILDLNLSGPSVEPDPSFTRASFIEALQRVSRPVKPEQPAAKKK
jgi:hypothetical protein